jgi:hypothetical protein
MKFKRMIYLFFVILSLPFSCYKYKESHTVFDKEGDFRDEVVTVEKEILVDTDKYVNLIVEKFSNFTLSNIKEIYLGESEKKYFLVGIRHNGSEDWYSDLIFVIDKNNNIEQYECGMADEKYYNAEIIMKNIPGLQFGKDVVAVGDFNDDHINDILGFEFAGSGYIFYIYGVLPENDEFAIYCEIPFFIHSPVEFSPVEFIQYKGISGFKILAPFNRIFEDRKMPQYPVEGDYRGVGWVFYCWDPASRKFVIFEEVNPQFVGK